MSDGRFGLQVRPGEAARVMRAAYERGGRQAAFRGAPPVVGPKDLPALRLWLREQWEPGRPFANATEKMTVDPSRATLVDAAAEAIQEMGAKYVGRKTSEWERTTLRHASLWWVAEPMCALLEAAARTVPDDLRVADVPLLDGAGLVVFARPLTGHSVETGDDIRLDAMAWNAATTLPAIFSERPEPLMDPAGVPCLSMAFFSRLDFDGDLSPEDLVVAPPPLMEEALMGGLIGYAPVPDDERKVWKLTLHGDFWLPLGRSDWPLADRLGDTHLLVRGEDAQASFAEDRRLIAALWTLLAQEGIATVRTETPARPVVRRVQRAGLPRSAADVRVVRLRELAHAERASEGPGVPRDWSHRWVVSGHWRNARVGPGRSERRLVWVNPYVKGPDDKPLRQPATVKAWVR